MTRSLFLTLLLTFTALQAANASGSLFSDAVTGLPNGGNSLGQMVVNGQTYWWVGIEPGAVPLDNAILSGGHIIDLKDGWLSQDLERPFAPGATQAVEMATLNKQVAVVEYVLDAFLPWETLAGASGRFLEQNGDYHNFSTNDPFLNAMFASEAFIGQTEQHISQLDFTDLSNYTDPFAGLGDATDDARSALFQSILLDVAAKDGAGFFANYTPQFYNYSSIYVPALPGPGFMDPLLIGYGYPVPEPSSALLIVSVGAVCALRRRRSFS